MIDDTQTPDSPGWWFTRLLKNLGEQQARYSLLEAYYTGQIGIPITAEKSVRDAYQRLMAVARTNYAELVVEALRERMTPAGFRTGADSDSGGDSAAWRMWQANSLDADSAVVHRAMLAMADSYVIVGTVDPDIEAPLITPEDPREVVTACAPGRRRKTIAALKAFCDTDAGVDRAYLYLPGKVYQAQRARKSGSFSYTIGTNWEWTDEADLPEQAANVVPVVRFPNRQDHRGRSWGEFETHLPLLDRINYGILQRLEIVTLQAFRQRAIKGDLPTHDAQGNEIDYDDIFAADPGALWQLPATAEIWESGQVDLSGIQAANRDDIQDLAAVTRTPLFYLTPDAANGSAEGASLAREGLVFKAGDRISDTSECWEQVMALGFLMAGDSERAKRVDMECIWASPERFTLAERADAAAKAITGGVPWRTVMTDIWQFSPQQVDRMETERSTDAALLASFAPQPPPAANAPAG